MTRRVQPTVPAAVLAGAIDDLVTVSVIWADNGTGPCLVDAWDEFSIEQNRPGWDEALRRARATNAHIRVATATVPTGDVHGMFRPA